MSCGAITTGTPGAFSTTDVTSARKPRGFLFIVLGVLAALVFAATAAATPDGAVSTAPWISSDKPDYAPGERVTLSGGGWQPGESVHIQVDDDDSRTWSRTVDVTADGAGNITDAFDLPDWFVALYTVKATGGQSGTASTTFTDGNVTLHLPAGAGVANMTVTVNVYGTAQNPNTNCSGSPVRVETVVVSAPGGSANIPGFGNANLSARLVSVTTTTSGRTFDRWTNGTQSADSGSVIPGSPQPCISSGGTGSNGNVTDAFAHFKVSNTAPTCTGGAATTDEDAARTITLSCTDAQGDSLTYTIVSGPANGTLSGSGSSRTYTPHANFNGSDSFTFRASDGSLSSATATFGLTVNPVNDAPAAAATPASVAMNEDGGAESIVVSGSDVETAAADLVFVITQAPASGTLKRGATALATNDTFTGSPKTLTYTPNANFNGADAFEFKVRDTGDPAGCTGPAPGCSAEAGSTSVTVPITVSAVNDAPTCSNGSASTSEDAAKSITLACADVDGDEITYAIVSGPSHGALSGTAASRTYTPSADYHGSDSFTFRANDGDEDSNEATFDLTVTPVNDAPVAHAQSVTTDEDAAKAITVTASDADGDALAYAVTALPEHGRLYPGATASGDPLSAGQLPYALSGGEVTYRPDADYHGPDGFDFRASDGSVDSAAASVTITVASVNDAPEAADDTASGSEDEVVAVAAADLLVNDVDVDGDSLTVTGVDEASGGDVALESGAITFTPDPNLCGDGAASFAYSIGDGNGGSARATVTIDLECVNDDPMVAAAEASVAVDEGETAATTGTWADVDGDAVELAASVGTVIRNADGTWSWSFGTTDGPAQSQTVTITASDGNGGSAQTTFGLTVENVAPSVTLSGATDVGEGDVEEYAFTVADPGADSWAFADGYPACGANGALVDGSVESEAANGSFRCRFPDGPKTTSVAVKVRDDDGGVSADVQDVTILAVTIANVPPTATFDAPAAVDEGSDIEISLTDVVDPGEADTHEFRFKCGDGDWSAYGSSSTHACSTTDDAVVTVRGQVRDSNGGESDAYSAGVEVENVAPSATFNAPASVEEGSDIEISLTDVVDPGSDTHEYRFSCDGGATWSEWSEEAGFSCSTSDDGTVGVRGQIRDDDGGASDAYAADVSVANVAPTVRLADENGYAFDESKTEERTFAFAIADPGADEIDVVVSCGGGEYVVESRTDSGFRCVFADDAETAVSVTATDDDAGEGSASHAVTVSNVAPTVSLTGATEVDEGDVEEYAFTVSDPGADTWELADGFPTCGSNGTLVGGSVATTGGGGSFECRFPDGDATTNVAAKVRDDDGGVSADVQNVTILEVVISNVAPAITAPASQEASEGQSKAFELGSFADPGDEAAAWRVEIDWGDGSDSESFETAEPGSLGTRSHTYADDGTYTVTVSVTDANGDFDEITFAVDAANVAPEVAAPANQASDEGETKSFSLGSFADPGPDGDWKVTVDWGDGSAATSFDAASPGSLGTRAHAYADNGAYTVTVRVTEAGDGERPSGDASFQVVVSNVAPTLVLSGASDVNEGETKTYAFTVSDPGANDTWTFAESTPTCGANGELVAGSLEPASAGPHTATSGTFKCFFPEGGTSVDPVTTKVVTKIVDNDGGKSADVQSVEVIDVNINNVAPTATLGNDGPVAEGSPVTITFTDQSDPSGDDTAAGFRYAYRCDGTAFPSSPSYAGSSASPSHECTYGDDGTRTVRARIIDRNGGFSEYTTTFGVTNVAPTASNASFAVDPITGQATASFSYSDFGWLDTHLGSYLTWSAGTPGSGASVTPIGASAPAATGTVSETRAFASGCHTLVVTGVAKDDDGAESAPVTVFSGAQTSVHGKGFRPPIVDNERNVARLGNVIPVKVLLQNACTGASVTSVDLYISLHQGTGDEAIEGTSVVAESVSTADTTGKMRIADGMYLYNLSTKGLKAATDYTIRIRTGSTTGPRILQAVIHPKK